MKKVAVVNRTNLKNFGSVLQCYALCEVISQMGYESEILWEQGNVSKNFDFRPVKITKTLLKLLTHPRLLKSTLKNVKEIKGKPISEDTIQLFEKFVQTHIRQKLMSHKELVNVARSDIYSKFVCGSDQIWCSTTTYVDPLMYLRFAPESKRIAYAPSIGRDYVPDYNRRQMKKYIKEIPYVSIREVEGQRLVKELTGRDVPVVLDPTLLIEKEKWDLIKINTVEPKPYLLCYFLDVPHEKMQRNIEKCAIENNLTIISLGRELEYINNEVKMLAPDCGPAEFLGYVSEAEMVVTDSYHGMLFSTIYEKEFWSVERAYNQFDQSSRQKTVLKMLDLESRYISSTEEFEFKETDIDYSHVRAVLEKKKMDSIEYLATAIEK